MSKALSSIISTAEKRRVRGGRNEGGGDGGKDRGRGWEDGREGERGRAKE